MISIIVRHVMIRCPNILSLLYKVVHVHLVRPSLNVLMDPDNKKNLTNAHTNILKKKHIYNYTHLNVGPTIQRYVNNSTDKNFFK